MLEMLLNPRRAEREPWEMFFIGAFYSSLSLLLVYWLFSSDFVLSKYSGILVVTFTMMFSMPFIYYSLKIEEDKIEERKGIFSLIKEHRKVIYVFLWLFLGFVVALSFWYVVLPSNDAFRAQIETFCSINQRANFDRCVEQHLGDPNILPTGDSISAISNTANSVSENERFMLIFSNNLSVLIFTLIFSFIFGAGVIFILAWNASVIAAAVGISAKASIYSIPMSIAKYIIHGAPEIASYFIVALAGGIVSVAVIRHEVGTERFWEVLQDSLNLIILSVAVLAVAALLEVFVTPRLF